MAYLPSSRAAANTVRRIIRCRSPAASSWYRSPGAKSPMSANEAGSSPGISYSETLVLTRVRRSSASSRISLSGVSRRMDVRRATGRMASPGSSTARPRSSYRMPTSRSVAMRVNLSASAMALMFW
jgi:hypothetical protein